MRINPSNLVRGARRLAAFTMIEIAISIGVIGFALVAIIGILPMGLNVSRDNREVTLVNFDASYLMNAIRSGARGQDELTNYIVTLTNYITHYDLAGVNQGSGINWYTTSNSFQASAAFMTNGSNIIGLLSTPKYVPHYKGTSIIGYDSNYITADFRAISGSLVDQGASQASRDFAFTYRVYPEIIPASSYPYMFGNAAYLNYSALDGATNTLPGANTLDSVVGVEQQYNLNEIRLLFRWPVLPSGQVGLSHVVFRSSASGVTTVNNTAFGTLFYIQNQNFGYAP